MSLLPYVLNDAWNDPLTRLYDQHFGLGLLDDDISLVRPSLSSLVGPLSAGYLRMNRPFVLEESGVSAIENEKDKIKVSALSLMSFL